MALFVGEVRIFCADAALFQMVQVLSGVTEGEDTGVPRLAIADADDASMLREARAFAREVDVPLILVSHWENTPLEAGESLIARPFLFSEFRERVCALTGEADAMPLFPAVEPFQATPLQWDAQTRTVVCGNASVTLTPREADVFALLYAASPAPVTREALCGGFMRTAGNGAEVYISYLRRKLRTLPAAITITAVRGQGYALMMQSRDGESGREF